MLIEFFYLLRRGGLKVSLTEFLTLLEALKQGLARYSINEFYYLSRSALVKDEALYDRFDQVFAAHFKGIEQVFGPQGAEIPDEWLRQQFDRVFSDEEMALMEAMDWDELMETLRKRLEEQKEEHHGGNKWIGTGGTSPFGSGGYNPAGIRIGPGGGQRSGVKVWDKREYRNLDDSLELGTRNLKVALRRLRKFARQGAAEELDLPGTIDSTARNAGFLDLKMVPERHNAIKVLLFLDVGGSMDDHVRACEELFSAAKTEFKHLEYFYFHNCVYEGVWKDNRRRHTEKTPLMDVLHKYAHDYKLILVGDATMSPFEITYAGGSVEHLNEEPGATWLKRLLDTYPKAIWLNPEPQKRWDYTPSVRLINELMEERMFPLTISGLEQGMRELL
ncbi:MAG TPA: VWA domain-containing protein [Xanthomonadales bacterium]|nr:VWA domain-containing protein [Xanthomonadales bacterium]